MKKVKKQGSKKDLSSQKKKVNKEKSPKKVEKGSEAKKTVKSKSKTSKVTRKRKIKEEGDEGDNYDEAMWEEVRHLLKEHPNYKILASMEGQFILGKTVNLTVKQVINENGMQPHEKIEDKKVCVVSIIHWKREKVKGHKYVSEQFKALEEIGCPIFKVTSVESLAEVMEKV